MKQIVILSGKGGTGKTTVTAGLAHLAAQDHKLVLADADVDAANLGLVLAPVPEETHDFTGGNVATIDHDVCRTCGTCVEVCRFEAVASGPEGYVVDPVACEGCAACAYACPAGAIRMVPQQAGTWTQAATRYGPLYHAHLFAGQENSGKLVTLVKQRARLRALDEAVDLLLIDGPPGIGCPVIAALSGADAALVVTEPTVSGAHDLDRILEVADHFGVPTAVLVNKADLSPSHSSAIEAACVEREVAVVGRLPYDPGVTEAMVRGEPITMFDGPVSAALRDVWSTVQGLLYEGGGKQA